LDERAVAASIRVEFSELAWRQTRPSAQVAPQSHGGSVLRRRVAADVCPLLKTMVETLVRLVVPWSGPFAAHPPGITPVRAAPNRQAVGASTTLSRGKQLVRPQRCRVPTPSNLITFAIQPPFGLRFSLLEKSSGGPISFVFQA
jgi:hypothetical protein